ncbi:MAG: hypothetical protein AB4352_23465 [Hormoscilla sp.]
MSVRQDYICEGTPRQMLGVIDFQWVHLIFAKDKGDKGDKEEISN